MTATDSELLDLLTPELRAGVEEGRYRLAGMGKTKPVVVDATTNRWVKGSGRPAKANDPAVVGKVSAAKRSRPYTEALQAFMPADKDGSPDAIISLQEMIDLAARAVRGGPVEVQCPCECSKKFSVNIKSDTKLLAFLIERIGGRATETKDINLRGDHFVRILQDQTPLSRDIEVVALDPKERAERARIIELDGS